ncbi:MAG: hypothetical protein JNK45_17995 [Myxococcales bacterium]|nr:hypothetical protein [Myxococcales bacterium]
MRPSASPPCCSSRTISVIAWLALYGTLRLVFPIGTTLIGQAGVTRSRGVPPLPEDAERRAR